MGYPLLQLRQSPEQRLPWMEGGLLASQNLQDEEGELNCLLSLGKEYNALKNWNKAKEVFEKAGVLAEKNDLSKVKLEVFHG